MLKVSVERKAASPGRISRLWIQVLMGVILAPRYLSKEASQQEGRPLWMVST